MPPSSTSSSATGKRRADRHDPTISPPPTKRKLQSSVSKSAVASFFTPASQKPKDRVVWAERAPSDDVPATLLVATYEPLDKAEGRATERQPRVAAFDLDSTIITTATGKKHADGPGDWKWWHPSVPKKLRALHEEGFHLVVFSNQGGLTLHPDPKAKPAKSAKSAKSASSVPSKNHNRVPDFKHKCGAVLAQLDLPVRLYAACGKDGFRKPRPGMWEELCRDEGWTDGPIDKDGSVFVGDAAGRPALAARDDGNRTGKAVPKDFSCSDRNFAHNVGLPFKTPEEFFLGEPPRPFARAFDLAAHPGPAAAETSPSRAPSDKECPLPAAAGQEVVVFCGPPGAGKSSFFAWQLAPRGYERVNQDTLKSKDKCLKAAAGFLADGASVAIDNTNPDAATRALWVGLAQRHGVPIRCLWFRTDPAVCEHNDAVRALNPEMNPEAREALPRIAFNGFFARFQEPTPKEGFADVVQLPFRFRGSPDEYAIWGRYWL